MIDPDRLNRTHVVNVRMKKDSYVVVLSDGTEITWNAWVNMSEKERRSL